MSIKTVLRSWVGRKGCGALPELKAYPLPDADSLHLPSVMGSTGLSLDGFVPDYAPLDQGASSSCVAQMWCLAEVVTLLARYGVTSELPSRRAAYYWARYEDKSEGVDEGCRPSDMINAAVKRGLPPESALPWSIARINQRPPLGARWDAQGHRGSQSHKQVYDAFLDQRVAAVRGALSEGRCFGLSIPVGDTFDACRSLQPVDWPSSSTIRGYHMLLGVDCDSDGNTKIVNSWGRGHGVQGRAILSPEYLARTRSLIICDPESPTT